MVKFVMHKKMKWVPNASELDPQPPVYLHDWLTKPYVVSEALRKHYQLLTVKVISQSWEADLWIREVFLQGDGNSLTYGQVRVPRATFIANQAKFESLGSRCIGETLLYGQKDVTRSGFEFTVIDKSMPLFARVSKHFSSSHATDYFWARQSIFTLIDSPLTVLEIFLPTLKPYEA